MQLTKPRRLERMAKGPALSAVGKLLGEFVKFECARLNVPAGREDLLLRPVDESFLCACRLLAAELTN